MEKDIPQLHKDWKRSCKDIMNGAPDRLLPLQEVNHQIPLIDRNKRYKYHTSRCPDSLKNELSKKIHMLSGGNPPKQSKQPQCYVLERKIIHYELS